MQGLVAGMNAARRAQGIEPVTLPRNSSYIGTLVDDLVTKVPGLSGLLIVPHYGNPSRESYFPPFFPP